MEVYGIATMVVILQLDMIDAHQRENQFGFMNRENILARRDAYTIITYYPNGEVHGIRLIGLEDDIDKEIEITREFYPEMTFEIVCPVQDSPIPYSI